MFKRQRVMQRILAAAVLASLFAVATTANAAQYHGRWDPAFGPDFPDLGWRGEATFFIPDACLAFSGRISNRHACANREMSMLNAEVEFYGLTDPMLRETLLFAEPSPLGSVIIESGLLTGVFGRFLYSVPSTLPIAGAPNAVFSLRFQNDIAQMKFFITMPDGSTVRGISARNPPDGTPLLTFTPVPEPVGALLMLVGLSALVGLRFRQRVRLSN